MTYVESKHRVIYLIYLLTYIYMSSWLWPSDRAGTTDVLYRPVCSVCLASKQANKAGARVKYEYI
jgi:hypothetical protein